MKTVRTRKAAAPTVPVETHAMAGMLDTLADRAIELSVAAGVEPQGNWRSATDEDGIAWWVLDRLRNPSTRSTAAFWRS